MTPGRTLHRIILIKSMMFKTETIIAVDHKRTLSLREFENLPITFDEEVRATREKMDHGSWMLNMI